MVSLSHHLDWSRTPQESSQPTCTGLIRTHLGPSQMSLGGGLGTNRNAPGRVPEDRSSPSPLERSSRRSHPKPKHSDYTLAKNFRLISLLECFGKLLEKVVAKLIYSDMTKYALSPTTQFGGGGGECLVKLDAGLTLLHDIQSAHQAGLRTWSSTAMPQCPQSACESERWPSCVLGSSEERDKVIFLIRWSPCLLPWSGR